MNFLGSQPLYIEPLRRVSLEVEDLSVMVAAKDAEAGFTALLQNVSLSLKESNMLAIMGGSGSGKTTLLNVLAQRTNIMNKTLKFSGRVSYSYPEPTTKARINTAYMIQEDSFLPGLTLQETLSYQADLRLANTTKQARMDLVNDLLQLLQLDHRKSEIVKSFTGEIKLLGGEQRRTSLAIQLLNKPQILFLDEPTTGLDTSSALTMVSVLRKLASPEIGITIVLSIHQPRQEVAELFDNLCVLTRGGRQMYYGSLQDSVEYLFSFDGTLEIAEVKNTNQAFITLNKLMASLVKDTSTATKELQSMEKVNNLVNHWRQTHPVTCKLSQEEQKTHFLANLKTFKPQNPHKFYSQVYILVRRTVLISLRDKLSLVALHGGSACLSVIIGWLFFKPDPNLSGIRSITSSLYSMLEIIGFSPLVLELARLWTYDGVFFVKEHREHCVSVPAFVVSRRLAKLFVEDLPMVTIFSVITYFMWGLRTGESFSDSGDGSYFGIYFTICFLMGLCSMSLAMLSFALASGLPLSLAIVNVIYQIQNSGCGYFVNAKSMPVYVRWVKYIAYFWYAFGALVSNQYTNWTGNCPYPDGDARCVEYTGNYQLQVLGFPQGWTGAPIGYLVLWVLGINVLTLVALYYKNYDVEFAKKKKNRIGGTEEKENEMSHSLLLASLTNEKDDRPSELVSINVENVTLTVKVKNTPRLFSGKSQRTLLDNVSANFKSDAVNVIMGPSGGGKTTFLNFIADRLPRSSYSKNGTIYLNNHQATEPQEMGLISAYVTQIDNLLVPQLTVRETLYFQARLRLPYREHGKIPCLIDQLLRITGLADCADTLIGSESKKGVSGGEKRRVSIAIQLLSRPRILFLDEPTSGLDSATSASILALLKELASAGTTIVTTLHQPSKEMFAQFDSLLLLAKGGRVVFNGPASKLESYLSQVGHPCPTYFNIADHALDILSHNVTEDPELAKGRVEYLIKSWQEHKTLFEDCGSSGGAVDLKPTRSFGVPWYAKISAVGFRQFIVSFRASDIFFARGLTVITLGIIYALFFAPLKSTPEGISDRLGLVQSVVNLYFCGLQNNLSLYPSQRDLFHQEYRDHTYGVGTFVTTYLAVELPFELVPSAIFSALVVFAIGLPRTAGMYFAMFYSSFAAMNCGESCGIILNCIFQHMGLVTNLSSNVFMIGIFMAGTMSLQMPEFFRAWNYINPAKYIVQVGTNMGFSGQTFSCEGATCSLSTGEAVLDQYGLNADVKVLFGALAACIVVYRLLAAAALYTRVKWFI